MAITSAPSWWAIIMVRNCWSNAAPLLAVSAFRSASDIMPGIEPPMSIADMSSGGAIPQPSSQPLSWSSSGAWAARIRSPRATTFGLLERVRASSAISIACR